MNRQKKELLKQIRELEDWIVADTELGCGFAPPGAYDKAYREIDRLQEELAHLMHYQSAMEMFCDERRQIPEEEILRQAELEQRRKSGNGRTGSKKPRRRSREMGR